MQMVQLYYNTIFALSLFESGSRVFAGSFRNNCRRLHTNLEGITKEREKNMKKTMALSKFFFFLLGGSSFGVCVCNIRISNLLVLSMLFLLDVVYMLCTAKYSCSTLCLCKCHWTFSIPVNDICLTKKIFVKESIKR